MKEINSPMPKAKYAPVTVAVISEIFMLPITKVKIDIFIIFSRISISIGTVILKVLIKYPLTQLERAIKTKVGHNNLNEFTVLVSLII